MKKYITFLIGILSVINYGCTDFLGTVPDDRTEIDEPEKVSKLLANAYPQRSYAGLLESRCDDMTDFGATSKGNQQTTSYEFMRAGFHWQPFVEANTDDSHELFWEDCYRVVANANFALEAIDKYGQYWDQVKGLRAEAKVCRAYSHFILLSMYSNMFDHANQYANPGIPYVTMPEDRVGKQYDRENVESIIKKIGDDLFSEIDNLPGSSGYKVAKFRFTRDAALAFAMRFCLFTRDWNGALKYSDMLLPTASSFEDTDESDNVWSGEKIRYVKEDDGAFTSIKGTMLDWQVYRSQGANLYSPGLFFSNPANKSFLLSTELQSIIGRAFLGRYLTIFSYPQSTVERVKSENATKGSFALNVMHISGDDLTAFWVKYYEDFKYVDEASGIGYIYLKFNLFRLEEVLLARAEAKVMLAIGSGDRQMYNSAVDDLNMYISSKIDNYKYQDNRLSTKKISIYYADKMGADHFAKSEFNKQVFQTALNRSPEEGNLAQSLISCIMDFRRAEFMYEGMRYFDVLRWNITIKHFRNSESVELRPDHDNRILQIPQAAQRSGLKLNPMRNIARWPGVRYEY